MHRGIINKYLLLPGIVLIIAGGILFFFYHFGQGDAKTITGFSIAYDNYDKAISDLSKSVFSSNPGDTPATDDLESRASEALAELNIKGSARISSLTKSDAELMSTMKETGDLSGKELNTLRAYQKAKIENLGNMSMFLKEFNGLTNQRQAAHARFLELAGLKN